MTENSPKGFPWEPVTIDFLKNTSVDLSTGGNQVSTLLSLRAGIFDLYQKTKILEYFLQKTVGDGCGMGTMGCGLPTGSDELIPCYFHWFGTSLMNYVRLVGFLDGIVYKVFSRLDLENTNGCRTIKKHCDDYVDSLKELAPVKQWRNKIAAHFAITDPKITGANPDNLALLELSTMYPIGYANGRFKVGLIQYGAIDSAGNRHTGSIQPWSLTEIYEAISVRLFFG
jgi:hypothetical protein